MSMSKNQINVGLFDRVKQLETELAAMTKERDSWMGTNEEISNELEAMRKDFHKLEKERDEALSALEAWRFNEAAWGTSPDEIRRHIKAEREKVEKLRRVANHSPRCARALAIWKACDCGLEEALEATK